MAAIPNRIQTDNPSFVRDTYSRALLNTDTNALERHRRKIAKTRSIGNELATLRATQQKLENRLNDLSEKLDRLFDLLKC